ncbi:hypothetical protein XENOCAPTIV_027466, partial [Xenoophorus captivus]
LVIIDTDCGIDDAQAIMMALAAPNLEVLALTCVFGNAAVENVCQNVLRVLSVCERQEEFFGELINQDAPAARFMKMVTSQCWAYSKEAMKNKRDVYFGPGFVSYDSYAMAACIDGSIVLESIECPVRVELQGSMTRGMLVLDRTSSLKKSHTVSVMSKCDVAKFGQLLMESLRQP